MNRLVIISMFGLIGCGWEMNDYKIYQVSIDPAFDQHHSEMIWEGVEAWETAVEGAISFKRVEGTKYDDMILIVPASTDSLTFEDGAFGSGHYIAGLTSYSGESAMCQVSLNQDDFKFQMVATHEIGHAIGMEHIRPDGTMMCADIECQVPMITCRDVIQFCDVWSCVASQMKVCQ